MHSDSLSPNARGTSFLLVIYKSESKKLKYYRMKLVNEQN